MERTIIGIDLAKENDKTGYIKNNKEASNINNSLTLTELNYCFDSAIKEGSKYIGVLIQIQDNKSNELIINKAESFAEKQEYYNKIYDENLNHKHAKGIKILNFGHSNCFKKLEKIIK
ncbi:hypothetical protein HYH82_15250 [Clostridium botulinum]|uniref:hypothetical protein n=1 Tax=Clostridium botulinum TaxID=1491 RepID=UPI001C9A4C07|nr:hypothetical protein [Clostridium botulinum]MBY6758648.1 hypothetical protein [Clostridium botulinum]MCR1166727.1 hypothetical protein [Clostridium botulinum]